MASTSVNNKFDFSSNLPNSANLQKEAAFLQQANSQENSPGQFFIYGIGQVTVAPADSQVNPEVQATWNEQMAIITSVMEKATAGNASAEDFDQLISALNELQNLAMNGTTDNCINQEMANALSLLFLEFSQVNIKPGMSTSDLSDEQKVNLLANMNSESLNKIVKLAASYSHEDLGLQTYVYTEILEIINSNTGTINDLQSYLEAADTTLKTLQKLIDISGYTKPPEVWTYDMELNSPADIPPSSVGEIQEYIEQNGGNDNEKQFQEIYELEYEYATERAEKNGTTVQYEMSQAANYPPHVGPNGTKTGIPTSAELLQHFIGNKGDEERVNGVEAIFIDCVTQELNNIAALPEGSTWTEVSQQIWTAKTELEKQIKLLSSQPDTDPEMIASLQKVVDNIDSAWAQAKSNNGIDASKTFNDVVAMGTAASEQAMEDFATIFINSTQPGKDGSNDLTVAVRNFENWNQELQKEFEKVMRDRKSVV